MDCTNRTATPHGTMRPAGKHAAAPRLLSPEAAASPQRCRPGRSDGSAIRWRGQAAGLVSKQIPG